MGTVQEAELEQRASEFVAFVKDFAAKKKGKFKLKNKRGEFVFSIFDNIASLEFEI